MPASVSAGEMAGRYARRFHQKIATCHTILEAAMAWRSVTMGGEGKSAGAASPAQEFRTSHGVARLEQRTLMAEARVWRLAPPASLTARARARPDLCRPMGADDFVCD